LRAEAPAPIDSGELERLMKRYRIAVDIGGTFVDSIVFDRDGPTRLAKASTTPGDPERGVLDAVSQLGVDLGDVEVFVHGTTLGLNAVLQRKGARTGIITNAGFRDIFEIARTNVPAASMYDFAYERPAPLVARRDRVGVEGRLNAQGEVVTPLDLEGVRAAAGKLVAQGVEAVAICFLHGYRNPEPEFPQLTVSPSAEITREYREYERTSTAVLDAYISPIFLAYIGKLQRALTDAGFEGQFLVMRSSGGAMTAAAASKAPLNTVMSGPAGGIVGAAHLARTLGRDKMLTLDYGGTSLDASVIEDGAPLVMHEASLESFPALIPIFDIRCIGAGGGSIAWVEEGLLQVGPRSAGADPGPIAYGKGGSEPTTTDAALILGYIAPEAFLGGALTLDLDAARTGMESKVASKIGASVIEASAGVFDVLVARTAGAIREITVERGRDPAEFSMLAFGGAGPMIAPLIAREVENAELIIPNMPAVFSAWGMLMSNLITDLAQTDIRMVDLVEQPALEAGFLGLEARVRAALLDQGVTAEGQRIEWLLECRYLGQEHSLEVPAAVPLDLEAIRHRFGELHARRYGHAIGGAVQAVTLRVRGHGHLPKPELKRLEPAAGPVGGARVRTGQAYCFAKRAMTEFQIFNRHKLGPGHIVQGPAIVEEGTSTTVIHSDQRLEVDVYGHMIIRRKLIT
jgi:N-methylhydantoinase A